VLGQVDAGGIRAGTGEAHEVASRAHADLQHALAARHRELGVASDERLELVALALDLGAELGGALRRLAVCGAARIGLPEGLDAGLLGLVRGGRHAHRLREATVSSSCAMRRAIGVRRYSPSSSGATGAGAGVARRRSSARAIEASSSRRAQ
jgi:hypothetical protein